MGEALVVGIVFAVAGLLVVGLRRPINEWNSRVWKRMSVGPASGEDHDVHRYITGVGGLLVVGGVVLIIVGLAS